MLARIQGVIGPFPRWMLEEGQEAVKYFTPEGCVYKRMGGDSGELPAVPRSQSRSVGRSAAPIRAGSIGGRKSGAAAVRFRVLRPASCVLRPASCVFVFAGSAEDRR